MDEEYEWLYSLLFCLLCNASMWLIEWRRMDVTRFSNKANGIVWPEILEHFLRSSKTSWDLNFEHMHQLGKRLESAYKRSSDMLHDSIGSSNVKRQNILKSVSCFIPNKSKKLRCFQNLFSSISHDMTIHENMEKSNKRKSWTVVQSKSMTNHQSHGWPYSFLGTFLSKQTKKSLFSVIEVNY